MSATQTHFLGMTGLTIIEAKVAVARQLLLRRRRRMILERAARVAADIALPLAVLGAVASVCNMTGWVSPRPARILFACAWLVWVGFMIRGLWACWRVHVSMTETAERMDLAGGTRNRLATALEFGMQHRSDGLYGLAISDAIQHAQTSDALQPILPVNPPSARFKYELVGFFVCLLVIGLGSAERPSRPPGMPAVDRASMLRSGQVDLPARESVVRADDIRSNPTHPAKPIDQTPPQSHAPGNTNSAAQTPASNSSGSSAALAQSNAGAQGASPGQSVASATPAPADRSNTAPMPQLADEGSDSSQSNSRPTGAAVASGSPSDAKNPPAADGQPEAQTQGDNKQPAGNSKQQNQNGGNSSGQKGETKSTGMNAQGAENTESTGGGGSGSGRSGSKKSRGVGMGLLGVRTPDLFKGQELPGPEQQSALPAAPIPSNETPASPSAAEHRQDDEPSLDVSRIHPDEADAVDAYFSKLHANK